MKEQVGQIIAVVMSMTFAVKYVRVTVVSLAVQFVMAIIVCEITLQLQSQVHCCLLLTKVKVV